MSEGEQGTISAEVIPADAPVAWTSSDETVATVDGGNVIAVAIGNATITASIVVEGVTYTDTVSVEVEAAPVEYETVFMFTGDEFFNNDANWLQKLYFDETRKTYMYKSGGSDDVTLVYNGSGSLSTLYADLRIAMQDVVDWGWDAEKNYALRVVTAGEDENWKFNFTLTAAGENFFTAVNGDTVVKANEGEVFIPLTCRNNITLPRLMTIQIRNGETPADSYDECPLVLELVELL